MCSYVRASIHAYRLNQQLKIDRYLQCLSTINVSTCIIYLLWVHLGVDWFVPYAMKMVNLLRSPLLWPWHSPSSAHLKSINIYRFGTTLLGVWNTWAVRTCIHTCVLRLKRFWAFFITESLGNIWHAQLKMLCFRFRNANPNKKSILGGVWPLTELNWLRVKLIWSIGESMCSYFQLNVGFG